MDDLRGEVRDALENRLRNTARTETEEIAAICSEDPEALTAELCEYGAIEEAVIADPLLAAAVARHVREWQEERRALPAPVDDGRADGANPMGDGDE